ncbi:MAG TPA: hypothetical protein VF387_03380 [Gemmatimonadaceae bacterium]
MLSWIVDPRFIKTTAGKITRTEATVTQPEKFTQSRGDVEHTAPVNCKSESSFKFLEIHT